VVVPLAAAHVACGIANNSIQWLPLGEPGCGGDITAVRVNPYNTSQWFIAGDMLGVGVSLDGGEVSQLFRNYIFNAVIPTTSTQTWLAPTADSFLSWEMSDFTFDPVLQRVYVASLSGRISRRLQIPYHGRLFARAFLRPPTRTKAPHRRSSSIPLVRVNVSSPLEATSGNGLGSRTSASSGSHSTPGPPGRRSRNISVGSNIMFADWGGAAASSSGEQAPTFGPLPAALGCSALMMGAGRGSQAPQACHRATPSHTRLLTPWIQTRPTSPCVMGVESGRRLTGAPRWQAANTGLPTGQLLPGLRARAHGP